MISLVPAPTHLDKYELLEQIGHGGMASVFRARDKRLQRDVALKRLHPHLRENTEIDARFGSEALAVAKLRHPNIVAVFDVSDEHEEERYLVMELVRGVTLRQLLGRHKALPVEVAAAMMLEVAAALQHAHAEGVIHRDVKPENVMIDMGTSGPNSGDDAEPARVKLMDFGIAKLLDAQGVTSTGQVLGSPAHMAPEQIEGCRVDQRADVFSLGVMFYEAMVGKLPFAGNNPAQVLRNVLEGNFDPPDRVRAEVGARWSKVVSKALQRDPANRPASIAEFAATIKKELELVGMGSVRHEISEFLDDPAGYDQRFRERIVSALTQSGKAAKRERDVLLATAQLNRALAYRPGDKALLELIGGLRLRRQLRRAAAYGGLGVLAAVLLVWGAGVLGKTPAAPAAAPVDPRPAPAHPAADRAPAPIVEVSPEAPRPAPSAASAKPVRNKAAARPPSAQPPAPSAPVAPGAPVEAELPGDEPMPGSGERRRVSIRIGGAVGGSVKIDGQARDWFGVIHELDVGEHTFEFVPPNDSCCVRTTRKVLVRPGKGVQVVRGEIPFKDATLAISTGDKRGWAVSCPTLFAARMQLPSSRSVPMTQAEARGVCTLTNTEQPSATQQKTVTLIAGQTTKLTWP